MKDDVVPAYQPNSPRVLLLSASSSLNSTLRQHLYDCPDWTLSHASAPRGEVEAALVPPADEAALRTLWRARDPKAAVYLGLPDFRFWRLDPQAGFLNAGFGAAFRLTPADLGIQ